MRQLQLMDKNDLGIELLLIKEPYYCKKCGQIVTEKHCRHTGKDIVRISGSAIRDRIKKKKRVDPCMMRQDVVKAITDLGKNIFIGE